MKAGLLRQRIDLQSRGEVRGPDGESEPAWIPFAADVPAEVLTGPGRELRAAGATDAEIGARINLRYMPGVVQSMRVVWEGQYFNITGIELDRTARRSMRLICATGLNDG